MFTVEGKEGELMVSGREVITILSSFSVKFDFGFGFGVGPVIGCLL